MREPVPNGRTCYNITSKTGYFNEKSNTSNANFQVKYLFLTAKNIAEGNVVPFFFSPDFKRVSKM